MGIHVTLLPLWARTYHRSFLRKDLVAGFTIAVMLIPQGMAYAMLAGLPPVYGIYASTIPLLAYAWLGSSRQLSVGPVAMLSLLVAAACSQWAEAGSAEYLRLATLLTLMIGLLQGVLGVLRAGGLAHFVSHAVISGFTSAAAILIALSQVRHLLGLPAVSAHSTVPLVMETVANFGAANLPTATIGGSALVVLFVIKRKWPRFPAALPVLALCSALVYLLDLETKGVAIVGAVPSGPPRLASLSFDLATVTSLLPAAVAIVFVGYMESMAVAQWMASKDKYRIDPNREFIALGAANLCAGLFSGYAVSGGFSRSAVNYGAGARTQMASVITSGLVLLVLLLFTPWFYYLPNAVLAAIIIVAVTGLVDAKSAVALFHLKQSDGWTLLVTFLVTLLMDIAQGILAGVLFSLVLFIARSAKPHTAVLGYVEREEVYRDITRYPEAVTHPGIVILRIDASLYFANAGFVEDKIREQLAAKPDAKLLVLDLSGVNEVDGVAVSTLSRLLEDYHEHHLRIFLVGTKAHVRDVLQKTDWYADRQKAMAYPSLRQAMAHAETRDHATNESEVHP